MIAINPESERVATDEDLRVVADALGRVPDGRIVEVPVRREGQPSVVTVHPLIERAGAIEPFPTLYWLVDPDLCRRISQFEAAGMITDIQQRIVNDADLRDQYRSDHHRYIAQRLSWMPPVDRIRAGVLKSRGIAGIADFNQVKCLHAHVAHHLADEEGNTVARILDDLVGLGI